MLIAMAIVGVAFLRGPRQILSRAILRACGVPDYKRWQGPATCGICIGAVSAPPAVGVLFGIHSALFTAALTIMILLALLDIAWRWLPLEWTLPLLLLGLFDAFLGESLGQAVLGALIGGSVLLVLQIAFRRVRGVEALGTGDIWLAAALGTFAGPATIPWVLFVSAVSGLTFDRISKWLFQGQSVNRYGVALGTHLIFALLFIESSREFWKHFAV